MRNAPCLAAASAAGIIAVVLPRPEHPTNRVVVASPRALPAVMSSRHTPGVVPLGAPAIGPVSSPASLPPQNMPAGSGWLERAVA
ncbi:hypothetical protein [Streptomyces mexicanus]|uniref:hypothetical protein n=1 Tax=Streptomyces mexicanus TaxID=178566 RepID=UPI0031ECA8CD